MTADRVVFLAVSVLVVVAIVLVAAGVVLVAGAGWGLIAAGGLVGPSAVAAGVVLLRDSGPSQ